MVSIEIISIHVILERQSRLYLCMDDYMCVYIYGNIGEYINGNIGKYMCVYMVFLYICTYKQKEAMNVRNRNQGACEKLE